MEENHRPKDRKGSWGDLPLKQVVSYKDTTDSHLAVVLSAAPSVTGIVGGG